MIHVLQILKYDVYKSGKIIPKIFFYKTTHRKQALNELCVSYAYIINMGLFQYFLSVHKQDESTYETKSFTLTFSAAQEKNNLPDR